MFMFIYALPDVTATGPAAAVTFSGGSEVDLYREEFIVDLCAHQDILSSPGNGRLLMETKAVRIDKQEAP